MYMTECIWCPNVPMHVATDMHYSYSTIVHVDSVSVTKVPHGADNINRNMHYQN